MIFAELTPYIIAPSVHENALINVTDGKIPLLTLVPCLNCGKEVLMLTTQKDDMILHNFTKYNKLSLPFCGTECKENFISKVKNAKSVSVKSMKNYEYALVFDDADTSNRPKEEVRHYITGYSLEQKAGCLKEKIESLKDRKLPDDHKQIGKYFTSNEVQKFLLNEITPKLKSKNNKIDVTAWKVMNKCRQMFPNDILIKRYKGKSRYILIIN